MALFQKSMAQDSVDRLTSCVGVLLLLLLFLIALLLPLSPAFQSDAGKPQLVPKQKHQEQKSSINFQYQTICWTPREFTSFHSNYVNEFCSAALNAQLHGENKSISIHENDFDVLIPVDIDMGAGIPTLAESYSKLVDKVEQKNAQMFIEEEEEMRKGREMQEVFAYRTPVILFVLAILLKAPSVLGSFLSGCLACINIDQTLKLATSQSCRSQEDQRHFNNQIAQSLSSKRSASVVFLFTKILLCIVLVAGVVTVCSMELPKVAQMEKGEGRQEGYVKNESSSDDRELQASSVIEELGSSVVLCAFKIRQLQNVANFVVQCAIRQGQIMPLAPEASQGQALPARPSGLAKRSLLLTYKALYTAALALLVVLLVTSVLSTLSWLCKLCSTCCTSRLQVSGTVSMDGLLLLYLAQENAGIPVASGLASALVGHTGQGDEEGLPLK